MPTPEFDKYLARSEYADDFWPTHQDPIVQIDFPRKLTSKQTSKKKDGTISQLSNSNPRTKNNKTNALKKCKSEKNRAIKPKQITERVDLYQYQKLFPEDDGPALG